MQDNASVRVRFAPSPTGHLHVGGLRSAYFNWLFARHYKGTFLLRIEDTDAQRSTKEYQESQLASLAWCGINSDEPLVIQSERRELYTRIAQEMIDAGTAYRCYCTPEELEKRLGANATEGLGYTKYDGKCRPKNDTSFVSSFDKLRMDGISRALSSDNLGKAENPVHADHASDPLMLSLSKHEAVKICGEKKSYAIRYKLPEDRQEVIVQDLIRGTISFSHDVLDDFIILRSDGNPMYNFSVVIDDHAMRITHIIRGEEHLVNTPKQILLYEALSYTQPQFAHVPLILGSDGSKLSKRDAAVSVIEYKNMGYLPEALCNYLVRLGWSHGDQEIFTTQELIKVFELKDIGKKGAIFDLAKLTWMNGVFMRQMSAQAILEYAVSEYNRDFRKNFNEFSESQLLGLIDLYKERTHTLRELEESLLKVSQEPKHYECDVQTLASAQQDALEQLLTEFEQHRFADRSSVEQTIKQVCTQFALKLPQLAQPIRCALTGITSSPSIYDLIVLLGKEVVVKRLSRFIDYVKGSAKHGT